MPDRWLAPRPGLALNQSSVKGGVVRRFLRRRGDEENPAWPGLVDVFAFGMVAVLLLSAIVISPEGTDPPPPPDLKMITLGELRAVQERLQQQGIKSGLNEDPWPSIQIALFNGSPVYFDSLKFDLIGEDYEAVRQFAEALVPIVPDQSKIEIFINGTADPLPLRQSSPPRDNVELSALRAAAVAAVLRDAGIPAKKIFVQGLGERGKIEVSSVPAREDVDAYFSFTDGLRKYRQVYLELRVDLSKVKLPAHRRI